MQASGRHATDTGGTAQLRSQPLETDVLVVGGGHAAMCAALSARARGARVLVAERAPMFYRGGNSRHTRDVRFAHGPGNTYASGTYPQEELLADLAGVTGTEMDTGLARVAVEGSQELPGWMAAQGVAWQKPLAGTLHLSRTNVFMLGGGRAMLNAYYRKARRSGVDILYNADVHAIAVADGQFRGAALRLEDRDVPVAARSVVFAAGGFEANLAWLGRYWGEAAQNFVVRGSPYNTGDVLAELLELGAMPVADPQGFHAVAVDGRAPRFDGGIVTRLDSVPFGIVVNRRGERFYDEGEDFWPKRYAIWGGLIARQDGQVAYSIVDHAALENFLPSVFPPLTARTIPELADALGLPRDALTATVARYNESVHPGRFDPKALDACATENLLPPKSHWALPIAVPPYYGYPLRPGITFTYRGVAVDQGAHVRLASGAVSPNMFAAGEIMAGNILRKGYLAGFGLTIGGVFGRIAGEGAALCALA